MILLDTNVFIYIANGKIELTSLNNHDLAYASITKIEALGYSLLTVAEESTLEEFFDECEQLDLDETIICRAIRLRQQSKMGLGDSIIAATAIEEDCELWTANTDDFNHIEDLRIHNPIKN